MMPDNLIERYARHLMLPDFTEARQECLGQKTALVVGLGGLGGHIAPLLCAAGVGRLVLADGDTVSLSNLQRQILYRENQVGTPKAECARKSLLALNSNAKIEIHGFLNSENARSIAEGCDIIVDGSDNAAARYLMNDLSVGLGIPFVYGSIREYSGQLAVFNTDAQSATYRCLFPEDSTRPDDSPRGVIGPLPAWIAAMQAHECIRILSGLRPALANRLFIGDLLTMQTHCMDLQPSETGRRISMEGFRRLAKR